MKRICLVVAAMAAVVAPLTVGHGEPPADKTADPQATLNETVGLLSGLYVYQSYLNIGLLADGKAANTYDERAARQVLASVVTPFDSVDKQLEKIGNTARTTGDREAAGRVRAAVALLKRLGAELTAFWDSQRPEDGARYEATRQEAWKQISALLGLAKK